MNTRSAARSKASIRRVLLAEWDPLGAKDIAPDEYDAYIGPVYRLLVSGAPALKVAENFTSVERDQMEISGAATEVLLGAAEALCRLNVRLADAEEMK